MKETPNWLEIPDDLMAKILQRLGTKEILKSARRVCRTWRRICNDPSMWKVIAMHRLRGNWDKNEYLETLTKQAVDLSAGELIDISIGRFCTDDLLHHIALRSSKLKRLYLWYCDRMTGSGLSRAIKRLPQLEELGFYCIYPNAEDIKVIGQNCPHLKSFKISGLIYPGPQVECDNQTVAIANYLPELRHLWIVGVRMTNKGFQAILNGCPHLESLHIHMSDSFNLDGNLVKMCMERIKVFERIKDFKHNSTQNSDEFYYMFTLWSDVHEFSEEND